MRPRNPFKMIEPFDYDRDSEEEFADMNGENINSDGSMSDQLSEYDQSLVEEGFIVGEDDYETFSNSSQEGHSLLKAENAKRLKEIRKAMTQQKKDVHIQLENFVGDEFRAVTFLFEEFPIKIIENEPELNRAKPNRDLIEDHFEEIAALIQGSRNSKAECIKMVQEKFPNISKTSLENFFKVCVLKDKMEKDDIQKVLSKQKNVPIDSKRKSMSFMRLSINSEAVETKYQIQASKQKLKQQLDQNIQKD